jgi:hypothetical protein
MNFSLANLIIGALFMPAGLWVVLRAFILNRDVWRLTFVERKFGMGTGVLAYQLVGSVLILLGALTAIGIIDANKMLFSQFKPPVQTQSSRSGLPQPGGEVQVAQ